MSFDSEHWTELQSLFHLAEETPEGDRDRVLRAAASDPQVLQRALEILAASEVKPPPPAAPLQNIGPYKILRHLGTGGTGAVYLAERVVGSVIQRSAVKVLAPHAAGPQYLERFDREQRILASLEHPNIVRMQDAGLTQAGQSYLAMDYVDGVQLDQYCDRKKLSIDARLRLFLAICDGVDYAHRKLVVHLDLKPSNILVTPDGIVKLLDFGTAKLLEIDGRWTATIMATPAYASPEQLRNEPVTTACDVYSLGVVLFELLTGRRPSGDSTAQRWRDDTARWREPEHPESAVTGPAAVDRATTEDRLRAQLSGDLSTVIRKALMPAPEDRYESVRAFEDDLVRYLDGRPVLARPQTTLYRIGKFVRRNRGRLAIAATLALALAGSLLYAWQEQRKALLEAKRAARINVFMNDVLGAADPGWQNTLKKKGAGVTLLEVVEQMRDRIGAQFASDPEVEIRLRRTIARTFAQLGKHEEAREQLDRALQRQLAISPADHPDVGILYKDLAGEDYIARNSREAETHAARAVQILTRNPRPQDKKELMEAYEFLGLADFDTGRPFAEVDDAMDRSIKLSRELFGKGGSTSVGLSARASLNVMTGRFAEAQRYLNEAIAIQEAVPGPKGSEFAMMLRDAGLICMEQKDPPCALKREREALDLIRQTSGEESPYTIDIEVVEGLADGLAGHYSEAVSQLQLLAKRISRPDGTNSGFLLAINEALGQIHMAAGQPKLAEAEFRAALTYAAAHRKDAIRNALLQSRTGECLAALGKREEAAPLLKASYEALLQKLGPDHNWTVDAKARLEKLN